MKDLKRLHTSRDSNWFFSFFEAPVPSLDKISVQVTQRYLIYFLLAKGLFLWGISIQVPCMTNFQSKSSLFRDDKSHGEFLYQLPLSPASNLITVPGFIFCYAVVSSRVPSVAHRGCLSSVPWTAGCQQQIQRFSSIELQAALVSQLYGVWTDSTDFAVNRLQILSDLLRSYWRVK